jgi:hypothetical protein
MASREAAKQHLHWHAHLSWRTVPGGASVSQEISYENGVRDCFVGISMLRISTFLATPALACRCKCDEKGHRGLLFGQINKISSQGIYQPVVGIDRVPDLLRPSSADGAPVGRLIQQDDRELLTLYGMDQWGLTP